MLKLLKYLKPYVLLILLAIVLLFTQAICELNLPGLMSNIVNVGLQSNGIEYAAPDAISKEALEFFEIFMNNEEKELVHNNYILVTKGNEEYLDTYKEALNKDIYVLTNTEKIDELSNAFMIAEKTFINILSNGEIEKLLSSFKMESSETKEAESFDISNLKLDDLLAMKSIVQTVKEEDISDARELAIRTDSTLLTGTGSTFAGLFYKDLGVDLAKKQSDYILKIGMIMLGITLLVVLVSVAVTFIATRLSAKVGKKIRTDIFNKVQSFSDNEIEKFSTSSLITRTTNDVTQIQNFIIFGLRIICFAPLMGIGAILMIIQKNMSMTWILALACLVIICLIIFVFIFVLPRFKVIQKLIDKLNLVSRETLSGIMVSRAFRTEEYEKEKFDNVNKELTKVNLFVNRAMASLMPTMTIIMNGVSLLIVWIGAKEIAESNMQIGDMMAFMQYSMQVIISFVLMTMTFIMIPRATVSANRINEVLETEPSIKDSKNPISFDESKKGYVEFNNVSFKYPGADDYVLKNISFIARPGKTTAFIGSTGSGKSTIIKLIPRFNDATEGEVLVNGINVKQLKLEDLESQIGYIPQKASLLSGTIESNIKYSNENMSDEIMIHSAKIAQAADFIEEKENKYDSQISQNAKNVSGGQKQRISIARAIAKNAPIYLFDDSFSALDFKTDSELRKALKENMKDATVIIVAQRVNTIMNADNIIVLDKGKIVGMGKHETLLKTCKEYYEIASSQLTKEELE